MSHNYCYACRVSIKKNIDSNIKIILCNDCESEKCLLINKTNAKKKFCLKDNDLCNLNKNILPNRYGKFTTLYYYDDVVQKAHKKYGGITGLLMAQDKRLKRSNNVKNNNKIKIVEKYNMMECRRNLIFSELERQNISYSDNLNEFYNYIELGDESGYSFEDIMELFREYDFLYKMTDYKCIIKDLKKKQNNFTVTNLKYNAKKIALNNYIKNKGNINSIPITLYKKIL